MDRRSVIRAVAAVAGLVALPSAHSQQAPKYRIGYLNPNSPAMGSFQLDATLNGLKELGLVRGRDFTLEERWARSDLERLPALAQELIAVKPDVLVAIGTPAALAIARGTQTVPIVFVSVSDPVGQRLVKSLREPGGNVTGVSNIGDQLIPKLLEAGLTLIPTASRIGLLVNPADGTTKQNIHTFDLAANARNIRYSTHLVEHPFELKRAFEDVTNARTELLVVPAQSIFIDGARELAELSLKVRVPVVSAFREVTAAGCLASYGPNIVASHRRAAAYVVRIFRGANPAQIPVEQPTQYQLVINLKTARALGVTIGSGLLLRADEVLE